MSRFSILLQTLTCGLSRQEPTLDIPVPAVLTAETVADEILDEDEEFVSIPIMDEEGSDLLTIGNAIPSSYAQEGAATVAAGQNLIAEREFTDPTGHDEDIEVDEIFAACRSLSINLYNHFGTKGKIGSLHTGKVMLSMTESELVGQPGHWIRHLAPARTDMNIAGGQCYMPAFLHHLLGKQRKDTKEVTMQVSIVIGTNIWRSYPSAGFPLMQWQEGQKLQLKIHFHQSSDLNSSLEQLWSRKTVTSSFPTFPIWTSHMCCFTMSLQHAGQRTSRKIGNH
jgi:hypothetical protein